MWLKNDAKAQAQVQARVQVQLLCDNFNNFNQGPFDYCFGHMHEDYYSLWTCLKVQNQEESKRPKLKKFQAVLRRFAKSKIGKGSQRRGASMLIVTILVLLNTFLIDQFFKNFT